MKRHSHAEISAVLSQAHEMMLRGQSQTAICKALGISVMTLHRWRKEFGGPPDILGNGTNVAQPDDVEQCWDELTALTDETIIPVTYMNSSAAIKSFTGKNGGTICTSSK